MRQLKNQAGLTLIEVLATITILSIVTVIIYNVFTSGLRYSTQAEDTVLIQQEANYLLTLLKEQHENEDSYTITLSNNYTKVTINSTETIVVENLNYRYKICRYDPSTSSCVESFNNNEEKVINTGNYFPIMILIESTNSDLTYNIKTILSRL